MLRARVFFYFRAHFLSSRISWSTMIFIILNFHSVALLAPSTVFQIHLFLSKAVSFFDRSGLNVTGAVNATNETEIEVKPTHGHACKGAMGDNHL